MGEDFTRMFQGDWSARRARRWKRAMGSWNVEVLFRIMIQLCQKIWRIGCVTPPCKLQHGITQPILWHFWHICIWTDTTYSLRTAYLSSQMTTHFQPHRWVVGRQCHSLSMHHCNSLSIHWDRKERRARCRPGTENKNGKIWLGLACKSDPKIFWGNPRHNGILHSQLR